MDIIFYVAIPFFVATMLFELWYGHRKGTHEWMAKDTAASLSMGIGNLLIGALVASFKMAVLMFAFKLAPFVIENSWVAWILAVIGLDLLMYWHHRAGHRSRFFWAHHVIHHSSTYYHLGTALRQTWTGQLTGIFWYSPLAFLGVHPILILSSFGINLLYQYWVHTEHIGKMWGWFEYIFNTPSHHGVHHSSEPIYIDKNYGGIFIVWDRMFGTFQEEVSRPVYGLTANIESYNPFYIAVHEWIAIGKDVATVPGITNKFKMIFAPPEKIAAIKVEATTPSSEGLAPVLASKL